MPILRAERIEIGRGFRRRSQVAAGCAEGAFPVRQAEKGTLVKNGFSSGWSVLSLESMVGPDSFSSWEGFALAAGTGMAHV